MSASEKKIVALCGGVGGAKLAYGLNKLLGSQLTVIVNTGDDFEHMGLAISPDIDTVLYTLGEVADEERGWGRASESWNAMDAFGELGAETWFRLGDRDLALHVLRTHALRESKTLTDFTSLIALQLKIAARIVPMTDVRFATMVVTPTERLSFQRYFVEQQARPEVKRIEFESAKDAAATPSALAAIEDADAIIVCPSNPYLSIDPILAVPGILTALGATDAPIIAVSPLVGGQAIKGPTAKIMNELGVSTNCASIARHYPFLNGLVMDHVDKDDASKIEIPVHLTDTIMRSKDKRVGLASECLRFLDQLNH